MMEWLLYADDDGLGIIQYPIRNVVVAIRNQKGIDISQCEIEWTAYEHGKKGVIKNICIIIYIYIYALYIQVEQNDSCDSKRRRRQFCKFEYILSQVDLWQLLPV